MQLLDKFPVLFLDMNGTFMFGEDRFGAGEDFHTTYRSVGGCRLSAAEVTRFIRACYDGMSRDYDDPERYDDFPSLTEGLQRYARPPESELPLWAASVLCRLASTHKLAVVANLCAPKQAWVEEFDRRYQRGVSVYRLLFGLSQYQALACALPRVAMGCGCAVARGFVRR
jgi:putative hydrolase of the HAD superfamily